MSLRTINEAEKSNSRITNLDFLRGFFIILALDEHFTYYLNMWYVEYFRDSIALTTTYKVHFPMIGHQLATDRFNYILGFIFIQWVSQVYLTLASFNLAKKSPEVFRSELGTKLKTFILIFIFFVLENFIVAPNMGQAISFYPIMLWMIILSVLSIAYSYFGIGAIVVLGIISFFRWIIPVELISHLFQGLINYHVHPGFEYDAKIEYFFSSGCLGFILGYAHFHLPNVAKIKNYFFMSIGVLLSSVYYFYGEPVVYDLANAFYNEHAMASTFTGTLNVLGIQAFVISLFLLLEEKSIKFNFPIINWVGVNSIIVFSLHRIFFVRILGPTSTLMGSMFNRTLTASSIEIFTYIGLTLLFSYFVIESRIGELILQKKGK